MTAALDLEGLKARNPIFEIASRYVRLTRQGARFAGPCPICGGSARNRRFEVDPAKNLWVCAVCGDGGDVIRLIERVEGCDFKAALNRLGGAEPVDPMVAKRLAEERAARMAAQSEDAERHRLAEIRFAQDLWDRGRPLRGTASEQYLLARGLAQTSFQDARLRHIDDLPYFIDGKRRHVGPAMLAAITGARGRRGVTAIHMTWLDPSEPGVKARIYHPETGEMCPAKKVRGSKSGGQIYLGSTLTEKQLNGSAERPRPVNLVIGEGVETVLSVRTELPVYPAYWLSAIDLGNLGGPAAFTVPSGDGTRRRVPGPVPDEGPAIAIPDSVGSILLLGDGDSDPLLTGNALKRAAQRWHALGRTILAAWAPRGKDFNDCLKRLRDEQ